MCGIFGIIIGNKANFDESQLTKLWQKLFLLSESRGKEAAGVCLRSDHIDVYKAASSAKDLLKSKEYRLLFNKALSSSYKDGRIATPLCLFGHSRLVTNGVQGINENNQPIIRDGIVTVHNGIVVNIDALWDKYKDETSSLTHLDSEIICYLLRKYLNETNDLTTAVQKTYAEIVGMTSIACVFNDMPYLLLATNNGSLYIYNDIENDILFFASEKFIIDTIVKQFPEQLSPTHVQQLAANQACVINTNSLEASFFSVEQSEHKAFAPEILIPVSQVFDTSYEAETARDNMRRCSKCILPETMPMIQFDDEGVCQFCRYHQKTQQLGLSALQERVEPFRNFNGRPDCIVAFSGGRDSSYGLHYIVTELGMKPVAYTYDWGMVTDLARRNQSRLCAKLGIEHILVSADITKKRKYIRKNVLAWLKKPELGMVPLFMAGDKQYITYPVEIRQKTDTELVFFCANQFEKTGFKTGFCGLDEAGKWYFQMSRKDKLKIFTYYLKQFMRNPAYINASMLDSAVGFYASFMVDRSNYLQFFNYIPWDEKVMTETLRREYDWEFAGDTDSSWRIGDGTAAFYNYIYYTIAGFSENDTFRSNQIRDGLITREDGLRMAKQDNTPRYESIQEYANIIGFDCSEALKIINAVPKLYMGL